MKYIDSLIQDRRKLLILIPALALVACLIAIYSTRRSMADMQFLRSRSVHSTGDLVDQRPWQMAEALAPLAVSQEEQHFAREAERLADHEVDQAFAMALRQATLETPVLTGEALELSHKVQTFQQIVKEDQAHVDSLAEAVKGPNGASLDDDLDVAKAQLSLDNDVLADAVQNLETQTGDKRSKIQQELAAREALMRTYDLHANTGGQVAVLSATKYGTLYGRLNAWVGQRSRYALILQAKEQADSDLANLQRQYSSLRARMNAATSPTVVPSFPPETTQGDSIGTPNRDASSRVGEASALSKVEASPKASRLAVLKRLTAQSNVTAILADRLQTQQQLSALYANWASQVLLQHRIVAHLLLQSMAWILSIILCAATAGIIIHAVLERPKMDHRRIHTLRTILILATQVLAMLLIVLVIFGPPSQVPTILGLATAGLTVAFQDFIVAFLGWFVLMGRNGIRIDDWVEINGVGGEVVEIGLFRTSLLETGNWTDKGHPTGRRVTFLNKFAISGQYFNFSTNGQWMWDEIKVNIPTAGNTYQVIELIHKAVLKQTEKYADVAEHEWQRATKQSNLSQFSAAPAVDMRPAANGIDIVVRYVTRASERFEMRNRLYQTVIDLLHGSGAKPIDAIAQPVEDPRAIVVK